MYQTGQNQKIRYVGILLIVIAIAYTVFVSPYSGVNSAYAGVKPTNDTDVEKAGDFFRIFLPAAAMGSTFIVRGPDGKLWDKEGTWQFSKAFATTMVVTSGLKLITRKYRPRSLTGSSLSEQSFPSGHTSAAFSGAAFINTRYGPWWGIPSYAAALFTAYSRVQADAHFVDDVTAGAAVGMLSNWLFVTPQSWSGKYNIMPIVLDDGTGLQVTMNMGASAESDSDTKKPKKKDRRFRFNFVFGPAFLGTNEITSPTSTGTTFDLNDFHKINDPMTTAGIEFDIFLGKQHEVGIFWIPYENRDLGTFSTDVKFAGKTYPADTTIISAWRQNEIKVRYRYNLTPEKNWQFKLGAGLFAQYTNIALATDDFAIESEVDDWVVLPVLHGSIGYNFTKKLSLNLDLDGIYWSEDAYFDGIVALNYRINPNWDVTLGYEYYARDIETSDLTNKMALHVPLLAVAYSW